MNMLGLGLAVAMLLDATVIRMVLVPSAITRSQTMDHSLEGWNIGRFSDIEWMPWGGTTGSARAKVLAVADDHYLTLIEAEAGYAGDAHEHAYPEFLYVIEGQLRTQGVELRAGDGYAAATGSVHTDFVTDTGATYVLTFRL